jgi:hypothetical protein
VSLIQDVGYSGTYKYPRTVPLRGRINKAIAISSCNHVHVAFIPPLDQLAQETKFQEQVPTFGAHHSCYEKTTRDGTQES